MYMFTWQCTVQIKASQVISNRTRRRKVFKTSEGWRDSSKERLSDAVRRVRSVCSDVDRLLLRCQQTVHGRRHRLHVDLEQKETKGPELKSSNTKRETFLKKANSTFCSFFFFLYNINISAFKIFRGCNDHQSPQYESVGQSKQHADDLVIFRVFPVL